MIAAFFPLKKLRRKGKHLLLGAILLIGAVAVYHEMVAAKAWSSEIGMIPDNNRGKSLFDQRGRSQPKDSAGWTSSFTPQLWKPEYKGRANLHVFEDWCGSSTDGLRRNLHYPLYPHTRTTVSKLAVSPQWTNYGLRIFGYLHPYADGEFVFALGSDDNSELWLSTDDSPHNVQLLAWVGKTGSEWTAPGEFDKYASQTSRPVRLFAKRRYFFEVIHKQNDRGSDHVEVAWQLVDKEFRLKIIESKYISLYTDESSLLLSDVAHIPQTAASHQQSATEQHSAAAEMLREDPRDTFHQVHMINSKFLEGVLPDCSYKPSYTIKNFPLSRYQGLQFVHMSYIYPNDYTRLTHMETERSCFYAESPSYMKIFGFSSYMKLDPVDTEKTKTKDFGFLRGKSTFTQVEAEPVDDDDEPNGREKKISRDQIDNAIIPDYGDDYDDYIRKRRRKLFSLDIQESANKPNNASDTRVPNRQGEHIMSAKKQDGQEKKPEQIKLLQRKTKLKSAKKLKLRPQGQTPPTLLVDNLWLKEKQRPAEPLEQLSSRRGQIQVFKKMNHTQMQRGNVSQLHTSERGAPLPEKPTVAKKRTFVTKDRNLHPASIGRLTSPKRGFDLPLERQPQKDTEAANSLRNKEIELNMPLQKDVDNNFLTAKMNPRGKISSKWSDPEAEVSQAGEEDKVYNGAETRNGKEREGEKNTPWVQGWDFGTADYEEPTPPVELDPVVTWNQTFQVSNYNLQALRSDWIDLNCNISGNLLLHSSDALPLVNSFMKQLNRKHNGRFTLLRVINVVKRVDGSYGSRYLLELELKDSNGQVLRLSRYIYALIRNGQKRRQDAVIKRSNPQILLCNPVGFQWNPAATVHFIVPVKNQARWVQQLITDMEWLVRKTGDTNFNLIITDFDSTDMDVRKALEKSSLPKYQYVKLSGNFERSAGLQAGVNLIDDDHSIVFLCDLHIHFPPSIIDTIRKHCVEGYMAFAPIVLRLDCGVTPSEARGYWEVNGFGLLGIYKSDLVEAGGMNTKEFTDRWGGEDWELLDRILQAGLEIERIFLRNFFHHYHSKRGMWNRRMSTDRE